MKKIAALLVIALMTTASFGQRYFTKNGKINFDCTSENSPENITAVNDKASSVIDVSTGAMEFAVLMKAFIFERALMQEHFNENYVESDKFPKAMFKGSVKDIAAVNLTKDGEYPVTVSGSMTLHGITKEVTATGNLTVKGGAIASGKSEFKIVLADYGIEVPSVVKDKVAREAKVMVDLSYQPMAAK